MHSTFNSKLTKSFLFRNVTDLVQKKIQVKYMLVRKINKLISSVDLVIECAEIKKHADPLLYLLILEYTVEFKNRISIDCYRLSSNTLSVRG